MSAGGPPRWGFHELTDAWAERLVDFSEVDAADLVIDVGAGRGSLTSPLAATGARVLAVELHPGRLAHLRRRFDVDSTARGPGSSVSRVRVIRADATDLRLPRRPFRVVANPPWAATSDLVRRLTAPHSRLLRADLVVERADGPGNLDEAGPPRGRGRSR